MESYKLISGIGLTALFSLILLRNIKRSTWVHSILRVDTMVGVIAGLYLIFSFVHSLLV
jgi:hypothetical protein